MAIAYWTRSSSELFEIKPSSSANADCAFSCEGSAASLTGPPHNPRNPALSRTSPVTAGKKYMSAAKVDPVRIISAAAACAPIRTNSGVIFASVGKIASFSQR